MKKHLKKLSVLLLALVLIASAIPSYAVAEMDVIYQPININENSFNGNAIWGITEQLSTVVSDGMLDNYGAFYSLNPSRNYGEGGLPLNGNLQVGNVPYNISAATQGYNGNDCIRLLSGKTSATVNLNTVGSFSSIYVLGTAGGPGAGHYANFAVTLNYTDGTTDSREYRLYDWWDSTTVEGVDHYNNGIKRVEKNSKYSNDIGYPLLHSASIPSDNQKLLKSITFNLIGKDGGTSVSGLYCGVFAITGATAQGAPEAPVIEDETLVGENEFTANWEASTGALGYYIDISTSSDFSTILSNYDNVSVGNVTSFKASGLTEGTTYYYRVRAFNDKGTSLSSEVGDVLTKSPASVSSVAESKVESVEESKVESVEESKVESVETVSIQEEKPVNPKTSDTTDVVFPAVAVLLMALSAAYIVTMRKGTDENR